MGIKYLKGIYNVTNTKTTRPSGLQFPLGLSLSTPELETANGANTTNTQTFDVLVVAGGGPGGPPAGLGPSATGGGGGAGGVRVFSSNNFTDLNEFKDPLFISDVNFIPITVGGAGGNSCFGTSIINCRGGAGGYWRGGPGGNPGGSGSAQGCYSNFIQGPIGCGIVGQGCNGGPGPGASHGGAALANNSTTAGLTSSITGAAVQYGTGGCRGNVPNCNTPNRGNGAPGRIGYTAPGARSADSGIVAIRYRNPAAPTTPLAVGGDCVCCTGGCIIHVFESSGFFNVAVDFSIN